MRYILLLLILGIGVKAQDIPDTRGKEFYFAFMPNFHNFENSPSQSSDSLHLYIVTEEATSATLNIWNIYEQQETVVLNIPADDIFRFSKSYLDYELATGSDLAGKRRNGVKNSGSPQLVSWHLVADQKVGAITLNTSQLTSDAAMLFPLESLGEEYVVSTYPTDEGTGNNVKTLSQFGIVATEDNTVIEIEHSRNIFRREQTVILNKNQIYLSDNEQLTNNDQTGTYIRADKKIAVFGSHERAKVPFDGQFQSRDHLFEQMPPANTWSNEYYVVPFFKEFAGQDDIYRVVSILDGTDIKINDVDVTTLDRGDVFTSDINQPLYISANNPILVSQIKKSSSAGGGSTQSNADPFLVIVPPKKNFSTNFTFVSLEAYQSTAPKYENHYLTVIADNSHSGSIEIDGATFELVFEPIANTDHQFAELQVTAGRHKLVSATKIGLYVYGYGPADSYGYLGGMNFEEFDLYPPELSFVDDCFEVSGSFTDSLTVDGFIESIELLENDNINLVLNGNNFKLELIDKSLDGKAKVVATDNNGLQTQSPLFEIDGFTFDIENKEQVDNITGGVFGSYCRDYVVSNNSDSPKTIENISIDGDPATVEFSTEFPAELAGGESMTVTLCFNPDSEGLFSTQIIVDDGCFNQEILDISQDFRTDDRSPNAQIAVSECPGTFEIFAEEVREFDSGIKSFEIVEETNINTLDVSEDGTNIYYQGTVIDRRQDARISISIIDNGNNETTLSRTFEGFTIQFGEINILNNSISTESRESNCAEVDIFNYGAFPKNISNVYFEDNSNFSIPQSALPIIIEPGETKSVPVCLLYERGTEKNDTLIIETDCDRISLPYEGKVFYNNYNSNSRCELQIGYTDVENAEPFIDKISPNPVQEELSTYFAVNVDGIFDISIINSNGETLVNESFYAKKGLNTLKLNSSILISGYYQIIITNGNLVLQQDFIKRE